MGSNLPEYLLAIQDRWSLTLQPPLDLDYNFVAPAFLQDGTEVVLKTGVPNKEMWTEIAALQYYYGEGAVRLLDMDEDLGLFKTLFQQDDNPACVIVMSPEDAPH